MKIYTKTGDRGMTSLYGSARVQKDHLHIEALGVLDELNSLLGVTMAFLEDQKMQALLSKIQNDLFTVGADIAASHQEKLPAPRVREEQVHELEKEIDVLEAQLGMPKKFILPGGTRTSALLHLCRAVTRRAERVLVRLQQQVTINPELLCYINRLSDLFYVLARQANKEVDVREQQPIYKYLEHGEVTDENQKGY